MHNYALVLLQTAYSVNGCPLHFRGVCCSYFTQLMWSCICFVCLEPKHHNHNPVIMTYLTRLIQTPRENHVKVFYTREQVVCLTTLWRCSNVSITFSGSLLIVNLLYLAVRMRVKKES